MIQERSGPKHPVRAKRSSVGRRLPFLPRTTLLLLVAATTFQMATVGAFSNSHRNQCPVRISSSSALDLFRPDWMRRAGRIEEKRKERRDMYEALHKRQDELGMPRTLNNRDTRLSKDQPQRYKVVASNSNPYLNSTSQNNSNNFDDEDGLAIYPFVPESEVEINDTSNILDSLQQGEIITAMRKKRVVDFSVNPPPMAVVAAKAIYNVQTKIQTDILWIEHDKGGWSPSVVNGVTRLIPVDENGN